MLARSTACRHGEGRTCMKAASMRNDLPVAHEEVGRLDVAVRQPGVPQAAHEREALVDRRRRRLGVADLAAAVEELGEQQVLPLRRDLDDAERRGGGDARRRAAGAARSPRTRRGAAPTGRAPRPPGARRGSSGRACTSGRPGRGSWRRASRRRASDPLPAPLAVPLPSALAVHLPSLPRSAPLLSAHRDAQPQRRRAARRLEADRLGCRAPQPQLVGDRLAQRLPRGALSHRGGRSCARR